MELPGNYKSESKELLDNKTLQISHEVYSYNFSLLNMLTCYPVQHLRKCFCIKGAAEALRQMKRGCNTGFPQMENQREAETPGSSCNRKKDCAT